MILELMLVIYVLFTYCIFLLAFPLFLLTILEVMYATCSVVLYGTVLFVMFLVCTYGCVDWYVLKTSIKILDKKKTKGSTET